MWNRKKVDFIRKKINKQTNETDECELITIGERKLREITSLILRMNIINYKTTENRIKIKRFS